MPMSILAAAAIFKTVSELADRFAGLFKNLRDEADRRGNADMKNIALRSENCLLELQVEIRKLKAEVEGIKSIADERDSLKRLSEKQNAERDSLRAKCNDLKNQNKQLSDQLTAFEPADDSFKPNDLHIQVMLKISEGLNDIETIAYQLRQHNLFVETSLADLVAHGFINNGGTDVIVGGSYYYLLTKAKQYLIHNNLIRNPSRL